MMRDLMEQVRLKIDALGLWDRLNMIWMAQDGMVFARFASKVEFEAYFIDAKIDKRETLEKIECTVEHEGIRFHVTEWKDLLNASQLAT